MKAIFETDAGRYHAAGDRLIRVSVSDQLSLNLGCLVRDVTRLQWRKIPFHLRGIRRALSYDR